MCEFWVKKKKKKVICLKGTVCSSNINITIWCTVPDYGFKLIHIWLGQSPLWDTSPPSLALLSTHKPQLGTIPLPLPTRGLPGVFIGSLSLLHPFMDKQELFDWTSPASYLLSNTNPNRLGLMVQCSGKYLSLVEIYRVTLSDFPIACHKKSCLFFFPQTVGQKKEKQRRAVSRRQKGQEKCIVYLCSPVIRTAPDPQSCTDEHSLNGLDDLCLMWEKSVIVTNLQRIMEEFTSVPQKLGCCFDFNSALIKPVSFYYREIGYGPVVFSFPLGHWSPCNCTLSTSKWNCKLNFENYNIRQLYKKYCYGCS